MRRGGKLARTVLSVLFAVIAAASVLPTGAAAEQASQPSSAAAGRLDVGRYHSCALLQDASLRCWGYGVDGALGYGNETSIGDDETPSSAGPVDLGAGRPATAVSAGEFHTCALLENEAVRCWGFGGDGRLGYGDIDTIGDDENPGAVGPVDLGDGHTARAITAGGAHSCAVLDDGSVRCWGFGFDGRLGYGTNLPEDQNSIGDDETPDAAGPVKLGEGRTATAITAGGSHTCALLDDGTVRCWGFGTNGQLGYGNTESIGDDETPDTVGPVEVGEGRTAVAISAGDAHTCALLDNGSVSCWGFGGNGRLGYGRSDTIGDNETPGAVGPVDLGSGRTAKAISAGGAHTCALLDDGSLRCWGVGANGQLGYANTDTIGDNETPAAVGPIDLGSRSTAALAISAGDEHTCARLDDGGVRCWGRGAFGELGYCATSSIGDDEAPGSVGPVNLSGPEGCPAREPEAEPEPEPGPVPQPQPVAPGPVPVVPSPGPLVSGVETIFPAKLQIERARVERRDRQLDVLAPITSRASGEVEVEFFADQERTEFTTEIDSENRRIRFEQGIPDNQADLGTGIMTITYPGDDNTRPQEVRLRAASQPADLELERPVYEDGRIQAQGTVSDDARGVVRLQVQYVVDRETKLLDLRGQIDDGEWEVDEQLSPEVRGEIARRTGSLHSYTLFTGYFERRIRGEMQSFQILGPR